MLNSQTLKDIEKFVNQSSKKQKLIVIYGPTACGKTAASLEFAKLLGSEVVSVDSRQIYQGMDIGTGKILPHQMQGIPHHLLDILSPNQEYSVGQFQKDAQNICQCLWQKKKIPILCGGTGLYFDSFIYDFDVPKVLADEVLRKNLENEAKEFGNEYVYKKLQEIDPISAELIHPNNLKYVIRALEVKMLSGKSKTQHKKTQVLSYDIFFYTPYDGNRAALYEKINLRIQEMFENGLIEEVQGLREKYPDSSPGLDAIGYREVIEYLKGNITLGECMGLVQQHNRNYAKRQLTWFSKYLKN